MRRQSANDDGADDLERSPAFVAASTSDLPLTVLHRQRHPARRRDPISMHRWPSPWYRHRLVVCAVLITTLTAASAAVAQRRQNTDRLVESLEKLNRLKDSFKGLRFQIGQTVFADTLEDVPRAAASVGRQRSASSHRIRHQRKNNWRRRNKRPEVLPSWGLRNVKAGITVDRTRSDDSDDDGRWAQPARSGVLQSLQDDQYNSRRHGDRRTHLRGDSLSRHKQKCPTLADGKERLLCPSMNRGRYRVCINVDQLCNERDDCPEGEDETPINCLFFRTTMGHFTNVVEAVVALTDHMVKYEERHLEL